MKAKDLRQLAANPIFISSVYNYCDRWCERCPLSQRCLNYAMERAEDDGNPAARDLSNKKFWDKLHQTFQDTLEMIREDAAARGVDLDDPKLNAEVKAHERAERRRAAKNLPLARAALAYVNAVDKWLDNAKSLLQAKVAELKTQVALEIGDPQAEAQQLSDFTGIIQWYQHFIYVKLRRAIESRASEELETDEEMKTFPKDSDGSAKIALIGLDRSVEAWSGLRAALGADESDRILDLLARLAAIRRETGKLFPQARAVVRPGFDEL